MRYGRKICKELFVILYVFIFLVSDPKLVRACSMIILPDTSKETITSDDVTFDFFDTQDPSEYHIVYAVLTAAIIKKQSKKKNFLLHWTCRLKWVTILLAGMQTAAIPEKLRK